MAVAQGEETFQELVLKYMPLVRSIAWRVFQLRSFDGVPMEEYIQFGAEGLMEALGKFDVDQGAKFGTYASHRIRGAILTGLERSSEVNQQVATFRRLANERLASLAERGESDKGDQDDPAAAFGRLLDVSVGLAIAFMIEDTSLYAGEESTHWDDGQANLAFRQLQERLAGALSDLKDNERAVIEGHYYQHMSFEEIAGALKLTKGRISQLHRQALGKLRDSIRVHRFDDLIG